MVSEDSSVVLLYDAPRYALRSSRISRRYGNESMALADTRSIRSPVHQGPKHTFEIVSKLRVVKLEVLYSTSIESFAPRDIVS